VGSVFTGQDSPGASEGPSVIALMSDQFACFVGTKLIWFA
jgi:hypothetical protein